MVARGASWIIVVAGLLVAGCGSQHSRSRSSSSTVAAPVTPTRPTRSAARPARAMGPRLRIKAAEREARRSQRLVLIDFGANWCPDCRALDADFKSSTVAPTLHATYVLVHVDVGYFNENMDLSAMYDNAAKIGIPALVVLKPDGAIVTTTSDGSFDNARTMAPAQVRAFLQRW